MDLYLPRENGLSAATKILSYLADKTNDFPYICLLSDEDSELIAVSAAKAGILKILQKPIFDYGMN